MSAPAGPLCAGDIGQVVGAAPARSGIGQNAPSEKPCAATSNPRLKRARKFSQAIPVVSSTSSTSSRLVRNEATSSSVATAGVWVKATA